MIDAVNVASQTVEANGNVLFGSTRIYTGCSAKHEQGSGRFVLLKPGVYLVSFNANVSLPATGTEGPITLSIAQDGEDIAGTAMVFTPAAVSTLGNIAVTTLVQLCQPCCCSTLTVHNDTTQAISVQDANFVITRQC